MMLILSFLFISMACLLLWMELWHYNSSKDSWMERWWDTSSAKPSVTQLVVPSISSNIG